jgi:hypothetical protein
MVVDSLRTETAEMKFQSGERKTGGPAMLTCTASQMSLAGHVARTLDKIITYRFLVTTPEQMLH